MICCSLSELYSSALTQEHGPGALAQQGEVRVRSRLHQHAVTQEDEADWSRQRDVETLPGSFQNLLPRHSLISSVHHEGDAGVSEGKRPLSPRSTQLHFTAVTL